MCLHIITCSQIWLNLPMDYRHFGYITKLTKNKKSLVTGCITSARPSLCSSWRSSIIQLRQIWLLTEQESKELQNSYRLFFGNRKILAIFHVENLATRKPNETHIFLAILKKKKNINKLSARKQRMIPTVLYQLNLSAAPRLEPSHPFCSCKLRRIIQASVVNRRQLRHCGCRNTLLILHKRAICITRALVCVL